MAHDSELYACAVEETSSSAWCLVVHTIIGMYLHKLRGKVRHHEVGGSYSELCASQVGGEKAPDLEARGVAQLRA